jgi:predicted phage terminase large subunit-like protein
VSEQEQRYKLRVKVASSLLQFTKVMYKSQTGRPFKVNWHHESICKALEKVFLGKITRLIINLPPRYSKTELAVVNFIAWSLGLCPDSQFIHASYSKRLATQNSYNVKELVQSDVYEFVFPDMKLRYDSKAKDEWRTTKKGIVYATGSAGTITGYGAGLKRDYFGGAIIIDDPHKAAETQSPIRRKNVIDWFRSTVESRKNCMTTPIIIIMQRLHEEDLSGFLLKGGNGEHWDHLSLPAIDNDGQPLWPTEQSYDDLIRIKLNNPYVFSSQYMQSPAPMGGGMFKTEWWRFYSVLPPIEYKIITGDTAMETKKHNDYSVFQCWGVFENKIYLIDQNRGKWDAVDLRRMFMTFWDKHCTPSGATTGVLRAAYIENKASGTGLIQDIKRTERIPIQPLSRHTDKVTRAMDMIPYIASGFVYLPEGNNWISDYLYEFDRFTPTMSHKHDDQIDPTLDAIDILLRPKKKLTETW